MKHCVITGGGSKFGKCVTENFIANGYHVHLISHNSEDWKTKSQVTVIPVNWQTIGISDIKNLIPNVPKLDLIFFNHNSSALNYTNFQKGKLQNSKNWQQSYFVACQLPFYLVHALANKIKPDTKIFWMLSQLIFTPNKDQVGFADYIGNKFTNACVMKSFSMSFPACFFGMHPDGAVSAGDSHVDKNKARDLVNFVESASIQDLNGKIFSTQGQSCQFSSWD